MSVIKNGDFTIRIFGPIRAFKRVLERKVFKEKKIEPEKKNRKELRKKIRKKSRKKKPDRDAALHDAETAVRTKALDTHGPYPLGPT